MPIWARYLISAAVVGICFFLRQVLDGEFPYPFLLFLFGIVFVATVFDRGSGFLATFLSAVLAWRFLDHWDIPAVISTGLFVVFGLGVTTIIETLRASVEELAAANDALAASRTALNLANSEKALLLHDIHHRVKNHLMAVSGMLGISRRDIADPGARDALDSAVLRLSVISRVYDRLHIGDGSRDGATVDGQEFIEGLCDELRASLFDLRPVALRARIQDVPLALNRAVSIGLIINEGVTNALKHAFPPDNPGTVTVTLSREMNDVILEIADDGHGASPERFGTGTGTKLIRALAHQQGGTIEFSGPPGTKLTVRLPEKDQE